MNFNKHYNLQGKHAFLSASKHHWTNYEDDKLVASYHTALAAQRGTELHELASDLIRLGVKLPRNGTTLSLFVNDVIGYRMQSEQVLYYSDNAFGTADAIRFKNNKLQIFDLKTGTGKTSMKQLEIYTAFFCLEYGYKPHEIEIELRIYQNDDILFHIPELEDIVHIMDRIVVFDSYINDIRSDLR